MERTVNKVELKGYLGADPVILTGNNGYSIAHLQVATQRSFKSKTGKWINTTTWHTVVLWNHLADLAKEQLKKGMEVSFSGKLIYRIYKDRKGTSRMVSEIVAKQIMLPDSRTKLAG